MLPTAVWINKPSSTAVAAEPADQRAPTGPQAGAAYDRTDVLSTAVEDGVSTQGGAH